MTGVCVRVREGFGGRVRGYVRFRGWVGVRVELEVWL